MFSLKCLVLGVACFVLGTSASVAPFIEKCLATDPNCILNSSKIAVPFMCKGIPALGMNSLDPMKIPEIIADKGELKLNMKNVVLTGACQADLIQVSRNPEKETVSIEANVPFNMEGSYVMSGKLIVDVEGQGDFNINSKGMKLAVDCQLKKNTGKDGKGHYEITKCTHNYEFNNKVNIIFNNLFNGDKDKAEVVNKVIDENSQLFVTEIGGDIVLVFINNIVKSIGKFLKNVPAEDLELV